ncbi:MAG TPA: hypothetical protein VL242_42280 [Sorangium sp.]|nr:hypothetical protein [Sorangium sp.]
MGDDDLLDGHARQDAIAAALEKAGRLSRRRRRRLQRIVPAGSSATRGGRLDGTRRGANASEHRSLSRSAPGAPTSVEDVCLA